MAPFAYCFEVEGFCLRAVGDYSSRSGLVARGQEANSNVPFSPTSSRRFVSLSLLMLEVCGLSWGPLSRQGSVLQYLTSRLTIVFLPASVPDTSVTETVVFLTIFAVVTETQDVMSNAASRTKPHCSDRIRGPARRLASRSPGQKK